MYREEIAKLLEKEGLSHPQLAEVFKRAVSIAEENKDPKHLIEAAKLLADWLGYNDIEHETKQTTEIILPSFEPLPDEEDQEQSALPGETDHASTWQDLLLCITSW